MNGTRNSKIFSSPPPPGTLGTGQRSNMIKSQLIITESISNIFKPNFVCLLTNERYKTYQTGFPFGPLGHAQGFGTLGAWGEKLNFLNMIMWIIKLKGMNSSPGYTEKFYPTIKLVILGWGQRVNYH